MKTKVLGVLACLLIFWPDTIRAQQRQQISTDDFHRFMKSEQERAIAMGLKEEEMMEFLRSKERFWREHILKQHQTTEEEASGQKPLPNLPSAPTQSNGCVNIDFETGTLQGWTASHGWHPLYNPTGCCPLPGGQQFIVTGNGVDPFGNFPRVAPGGNFSLRLGNNLVNGEADRIEQTFPVTAANAFFTYRYAVVLQDPGHTAAQQPAFVIEMFDQNNNPIPCTYYAVQAAQNIPGFQNGINGVVYKPWSNVSIDLTPYIGQNVTIRFTTYDCALGGHFGYAYIDGICNAFVTIQNDTICPGTTKTLTAPTGFMQYTWNGPGVNNQNGQSILISNPGNYTVNTTMFTGCPGPSFVFPVYAYPVPQLSFTTNGNPCQLTQTFFNQSQIASGSIVSYTWNFGNNQTNNATQPTWTFPGPGNYIVQLSGISNKGCLAQLTKTIQVLTPPAVNISYNTLCENATGTLNAQAAGGQAPYQYQWNIQNSTYNQPAVQHFFISYGSFPVSITVTAANGCTASAQQQVTVHPVPVLQFSSNTVCEGYYTQFQNLSNIPNGQIIQYNWNFNGYGISTNVNPSFQFPSNGIYTVNLTAVSQAGCSASLTKTAQVYPNPVASFQMPSQICADVPVQFVNTSSVQGGYIAQSIWNLGNSGNVNSFNAYQAFSQPGSYPIQLTVFSQYMCASSVIQTLQVLPVPNLNAQISNACEGQMTNILNTSFINNGQIQTWNWDFESDGIVDNNNYQPGGYFYSAPGQYTITMSAVSTQGCSAEKKFIPRVYALPKADFTAKSVCLGKSVSFTNLSSSVDGGIQSYQWEFYGNGQVNNVFPNPVHTYTQPGTYLVKLEVQSQYGCVNTISKPVRVFPNPVASFTLTRQTACEILCTSLINQSSIESGKIAAYLWYFGDGSYPSTQANPSHCFKPGKYDITLQAISDSGCVSSYTLKNAVEVYPSPVAGFKVSPDEMEEMQPEIQVYNEATGADGITYFVSDGYTTSQQNFTYIFKNLKDGEVPTIAQVAVNYHGCKDTLIKPVKIKPSSAIYFPNTFTPNGDGINDGFFAKGYNILEYELRIYDRWGNLLFKTNDMNEAWDGTVKGSDDPIKSDVYVWKAWVKDIFHRTKEYVGHVTLLK